MHGAPLRDWRALLQRAVERLTREPLPLAALLSRAERRALDGDAVDDIRFVPELRIGGRAQVAILAVPRSELRFELELPPAARLVADVAAEHAGATGEREPPVVEFAVSVDDGGGEELLARRRVAAGAVGADAQECRLAVPLSRWGGRRVALVLRTSLRSARPPARPQAYWGDPRVLERVAPAEAARRLSGALSARGLAGSWRAARNVLRGRTGGGDPESLYRLWLRSHVPDEAALSRMQAEAAAWGAEAPRIGIATPVHETPRDLLERCAASVLAQRYPHWEWYLYDDGSRASHVGEVLGRLARADPRIRTARGGSPRGIAAACNAALALGDAPWIAWLDHDDELAPEALYEVASRLRADPALDLVYSDEDKLEPDGRRSTPFFKPDWSPEYLRSCMYTAHLSVYRRALLEALGGFREGFDGAQDYDLALRASERGPRVGHVPKVLYHWRKHGGSTAARVAVKPGAAAAGRRALAEHLERSGRPGPVEETAVPGIYRARPRIAGAPAVSVLIPTRDQPTLLRRCVESLEQRTAHRPLEIVLVDNGSADPEACAYLERTPHRVVRDPAPFNFSRLVNRGAAAARGDYLVLLNNDVEARDPGWCTALLEWCQDPEIGAVGAKLCYPDGRIQHAGIVLGAGGVAGHVARLAPRQSFGYLGTLLCVRNYSAVTAACMMVSRGDFEALGGFDEELAAAFNDVDFCLRLAEAGRRVICTPHAELLHHESASRPRLVDPVETRIMRERWGERLAADPYWNPNLSLERADFSLGL